MTEINPYLLFLLILSLLAQGTFLFIHAKKNRSFAWFWGIWGLISLPLPSIIYLLFIILPQKRKARKEK
ncbi:transcriptional regulator [Niallia alba]|nr:transcriptional regulator [Niallia alba]